MNTLLLKSIWIRLIIATAWIAIVWVLFFWVTQE